MKRIPYKKQRLPAKWIPGFNWWLILIRAEANKMSLLSESDYLDYRGNGQNYEPKQLSFYHKRFGKPMLELWRKLCA